VELLFTPSGTLSGLADITGSIPLSVDVSGVLENGSSSELIGAVGLSFDVTSALTGTGSIPGAITLTIGVDGGLTGVIDVAHWADMSSVDASVRLDSVDADEGSSTVPAFIRYFQI
jgi:hypothetical protein